MRQRQDRVTQRTVALITEQSLTRVRVNHRKPFKRCLIPDTGVDHESRVILNRSFIYVESEAKNKTNNGKKIE